MTEDEKQVLENYRARKRKKWKSQKKKKEFSKVMLFYVTFFVSLITVTTLLIMIITKDTSPVQYLLTGWFTEFSVATGFYYNKAKNENIRKIEKTYEEEQ